MKILLIDDEQGILDLLREELESAGRKFLFAKSVSGAWAILEREKDIDLIISDFILDKDTSLAIVEKLKNDCRKIPIIIFSNNNSEELKTLFEPVEYYHLLDVVSKVEGIKELQYYLHNYMKPK